MAWDKRIPFDIHGNMLDYVSGDTYYGNDGTGYKSLPVTWQSNFEFSDTLKYCGYERGRSSSTLIFERSNGQRVQFFMSDFDDIMNHAVKGRLTATFTFVKRGANYGCRLVRFDNLVQELAERFNETEAAVQ